MQFQLCNCQGYVPPEAFHELAGVTPLCGLKWQQNGTSLKGRTLRTQCTYITEHRRCPNSTTFDYRYCHQHLRMLYSLIVCPTTIPNLKGWGLFAVNPKRYETLGLDKTRRPIRDPNCVVIRKGNMVGGLNCYFVGEYITDYEAGKRYPKNVCGDYVIDDSGGLIDGQVARTVLQFSNDAVNLYDSARRRNTPNNICMPNWPIIQNADGIDVNGRVHLCALQDIYHGDEIFWSYSGDGDNGENDYWKASNH